MKLLIHREGRFVSAQIQGHSVGYRMAGDAMHAFFKAMMTRRNGFVRALTGVALTALALVATACASTPASSSRTTRETTTTTASSTTTSPPSSTTTTSPGHLVGPPGGPVPADFQADSFTAVSLDEWWMLGTARCLAGSGICSAIVRTTDGGSEFVGIPTPKSLSAVSQLRFASALDGYAFGPELWETVDGGAIWAKISAPGQVTELEAADGEAYELVTGAGSANGTSNELLRSAVGSSLWQQVHTPGPLGYGSQFAVNGPNLYVLGGNGDLVLLYSADRGASFNQRVDPCTAGLGGSLSAAADGSPTLWAACPTGMMAEAMLSTNGGVTWRVATRTGVFPNSLKLSAASSSAALASPAPQPLSGALVRTTNGGGSFLVVLPGSSSSRVSWTGFSDASRAYAILAGSLYESSNGGGAWRSVVVKG